MNQTDGCVQLCSASTHITRDHYQDLQNMLMLFAVHNPGMIALHRALSFLSVLFEFHSIFGEVKTAHTECKDK